MGIPKSPENKPFQLHFILTCNSGKANQGETKLWAVFASTYRSFFCFESTYRSMTTADHRYYLIAQTIIDDDVILPQVPECFSRSSADTKMKFWWWQTNDVIVKMTRSRWGNAQKVNRGLDQKNAFFRSRPKCIMNSWVEFGAQAQDSSWQMCLAVLVRPWGGISPL